MDSFPDHYDGELSGLSATIEVEYPVFGEGSVSIKMRWDEDEDENSRVLWSTNDLELVDDLIRGIQHARDMAATLQNLPVEFTNV